MPAMTSAIYAGVRRAAAGLLGNIGPCRIGAGWFGRVAAGLLLIGLGEATEAGAQIRLLSGPVLGYELGAPLDIDRTWSAAGWSLFPMDGSSSGRSIRIGSRLLAQSSGPWGVSGELGVVFTSGTFQSNPVPGPPVVDTLAGNNTAPYTFAVTSSSLAIQLDLLVRYQVTSLIGLGLGPWGAIRPFARYTYSDAVQDLSTGRDGVVVDRDGTAFGQLPLSYGVALALPIALPIAEKGMALSVEPYLRADLNGAAGRSITRSLSAGADLALLFDMSPLSSLSPPPSASEPPPPVVAAEGAEERPLEASIDIYCVDQHGEHHQISELYADTVTQRREIPLPPMIFFDRGSASVPSRYVVVQAGQFSPNTLAGLSAAGTYYHALNILGYRMRRLPDARLRLIGSRSKDEPAALARGRAEDVRRYLVTIWGIDSSRLAVATRAPGSRAPAEPESERSVRIEGDEAITSPVQTVWKARRFIQPVVDLQPVIRARAGVRRWEVVVRRGGVEMGRTSGADGIDLSIHIPDDTGDTLLPALEAELSVEDSTGAMVVARDTLPMRIAQGSRPPGRVNPPAETTIYLLFGDEEGRPRGVEKRLRRIADSIAAGARVTITGPAYGGAMGNRLPLRAEDVARDLRAFLGVRDVRLTVSDLPAAVSEGSSPEERLLATGVRISIEQ